MKIIIAQESYASRQNKIATTLYTVMLVITVTITASLFALQAFLLGRPIWGLVTVLVLSFYIYVNKDRQEIREYIRKQRLGVFGEKQVAELLSSSLGDEYVYVRNFTVPGAYCGDIDGILIGPKGLILMEIKTWPGRLKIDWGEFFKIVAGGLFRLKSPKKQIEDQIKALRMHFDSQAIKIPFTPMIVFVEGNLKIVGKTGISVVLIKDLLQRLSDLPEVPFPHEKQNQILEALNAR